MNDHTFCRILLSDVMSDVREAGYSPEDVKAAWAYKVGSNQFEFHGPKGHYNHDVRMADCLWSAVACGWRELLAEECGVA